MTTVWLLRLVYETTEEFTSLEHVWCGCCNRSRSCRWGLTRFSAEKAQRMEDLSVSYLFAAIENCHDAVRFAAGEEGRIIAGKIMNMAEMPSNSTRIFVGIVVIKCQTWKGQLLGDYSSVGDSSGSICGFMAGLGSKPLVVGDRCVNLQRKLKSRVRRMQPARGRTHSRILTGIFAAESDSLPQDLTGMPTSSNGFGALIGQVPRENLAEIEDLQVGTQLEAHTPEGVRVVHVIGIDDDNATVDANHPLAGVTLHFDLTVIDVRDATAEEVEHGHPHGSGGHEH